MQGSGIAPEPIRKGEELRHLDRLFRDRLSRGSVEKVPQGSLVELGIKYGYVRDSSEEEHYRRDWFDAEKGWFRGLAPLEPALREAFNKVTELARESNLPLDTYWVRGGDQVEIAICKSEHQITMLIMTPPPNFPGGVEPRGKFHPVENIWVVRGVRGDDGRWTDHAEISQVGAAV